MTNHKQERAQRIVDATMELTLRPQQGDRAKVIAAAIRAIVNELHYDNGVWFVNAIPDQIESSFNFKKPEEVILESVEIMDDEEIAVFDEPQ